MIDTIVGVCCAVALIPVWFGARIWVHRMQANDFRRMVFDVADQLSPERRVEFFEEMRKSELWDRYLK